MKRYLTWAVAGVLVLWAGNQAINFYHIKFPDRTHTMIEPLKNMQTFCVGRFLIDLPSGTKIESAFGTGRDARYSAESPVSRAKFAWKVAERWEVLEPMKADAYGKPYVGPSKRLEPMSDAVVFAYEHVLLSGPDAFGVDRDRVYAETEGYLWRDKVLYSFTDLATVEQIIDTMRTLQVLPDGTIPSEPGFCGPRSFFPGGYRPESVEITFSLPANPSMSLTIETTTYPNQENTPVEPPRPDIVPFESEDFKGRDHRDAKRSVAGRDGVEWATGSTERQHDTFQTYIFARWFTPGTPASSGRPAITAKLEIAFEAAEPPAPWGDFPPKSSTDMIDKEAFMTYWDTILDTLRPRPGALPPGEH